MVIELYRQACILLCQRDADMHQHDRLFYFDIINKTPLLRGGALMVRLQGVC
jgi:hypothetical protein